MLSQLQNLKNQNYGFMVIGQSGLDDEDLYYRAINGEDISGAIGLSDLRSSKRRHGKKNKKHSPKKSKKAKKGTSAYLANLDTELDYYHSDGRTDFKGNRNTRTHIKDVSMGAGSNTSFGLLNLVEDKDLLNLASTHDGDVCEGSYFKLGDVDNQNVMLFGNTGKNCVNAGHISGEAGSMTIFKGL